MDANKTNLIRLPIKDSKLNCLNGFWQWVELLAKEDYRSALEALYWSEKNPWTAETLKKRVTTFFGGKDPWSVVIPNQRLTNVINDGFDFKPRGRKEWGWFMGQIPLTTEPADPKKDDIPLMGLAASFFVRPHGPHYVMEFEIFHA